MPLTKVKRDETTEDAQKDASNVEPKVTRSRTETSSTSVEYSRSPQKYKGSHKFSSKIKSRLKDEEKSKVKVKGYEFPPTEKPTSNVWAVPTVFDDLSTETSRTKFENDLTSFTPKANQNPFFSVPPPLEISNAKIHNETSKYRTKSVKTKTTSTTEKPENIKAIEKQINNYSSKYLGSPLNGNSTGLDIIFPKSKGKNVNKTSKYHNLYSKFPKRSNPFKPKKAPSKSASNVKEFVFASDEEQEERPDKRIVLPTIGYINSLTSAHFGKENTNNKSENKKPLLTTALNLTEALNYLRFNTNGFKPKPIEEMMVTGIPHFEPMKLKKPRSNATNTKVKRDLSDATGAQQTKDEKTVERHEDEDDDEGEIVHDKKNDEIAEEERKRIEEENREKEKYEKELSEEITKKEKKILKETYENLGVNEDLSEKFPSFPTETSSEKPEDYKISTTPMPVDVKKYPFYFLKGVPRDSPLRYATHPRYFPRKSGHRMEFYESRDRLIQCPDVNVNLEDIPKSNSTKDLKTQPGENPRIVGLGDKITCLKIKYFDEDPLDSPFFREKEIDYVGKPKRKQAYRMVNNVRKYPVSDPTPANSVNYRKKVRRNGAQLNPAEVRSLLPTAPAANETFRYHSSYQYEPNKTLQIMIKDQKADNNSPQGSRIKYHSVENKIPSLNETSVAETKRIPQSTVALNKTRENVRDRVIPVKEQVDEPPPNYYIRTMGKLALPYPPKRKIIRPNYYRLAGPHSSTKIITTHNKIIIPHNCMHMITKMGAMADDRNLIVDCKDAILIQEVRNGAKHIKIMPKFYQPPKITPKPPKPDSETIEKIKENPQASQANQPKQTIQKRTPQARTRIPFSISIRESYSDQSDWVPIVSYPPVANTIAITASPYQFSRKSDEVIPDANESTTENATTTSTSSNHYIIDELKEDEDVRKGEVVEDKAHVFNLMNETESAETTTETTTTEVFESLKTESTRREKREAGETENSKKRKKSKLFLDKKLLDQIHGKKPVKKSLDDVIDLGINSPDDFTEKIPTTSISTIQLMTNDTKESTTFKPEININKKFESKRPLNRLSGLEFLIRYNKNKNKSNKQEKSLGDEFWKLNKPRVPEASTQKTTESSTQNSTENTKKGNFDEPKKPNNSEEKLIKTTPIPAASASSEKKITHRNSTVSEEGPVLHGSRYVQGSDGPILYYVVDKKTGRGRWLTNYEEDKNDGENLKVRSDPRKDSEFEKMNYGSKNDRKVQKQKIRKNFFKRRLNKSTSESNTEK